MISKPANTEADLLNPIRERWSPRAFELERELSAEHLHEVLEAARWAPSAFNEQPWRLLVFGRQDALRAEVEAQLNEGNAWARRASHLIVVGAATHSGPEHKPNRYAFYDTGAAAISLVLQAQSRGIIAHQMAGFQREALKTLLQVPEAGDLIAIIALGYEAEDKSFLPEHLQQREQAPRQRKELTEICVMGGKWQFN